jgi:hypothetical protein
MNHFENQFLPPDSNSADKNLFEKFQAENPERNVVFTAMEKIKDEAQMQEFFSQYVKFLKENGTINPEAIAQMGLERASFHYDPETVEIWKKFLNTIIIPPLEKPILPENNLIGKKKKK